MGARAKDVPTSVGRVAPELARDVIPTVPVGPTRAPAPTPARHLTLPLVSPISECAGISEQ